MSKDVEFHDLLGRSVPAAPLQASEREEARGRIISAAYEAVRLGISVVASCEVYGDMALRSNEAAQHPVVRVSDDAVVIGNRFRPASKREELDVERLAAVLRGMGIVEFERAGEFAELIAARYEKRPVR